MSRKRKRAERAARPATPDVPALARRTEKALEPTLYLFDGYNLLHAGDFGDPRELEDVVASFVALRGVRGVLVFDGAGRDRDIGPLQVRFAEDADTLLERLAVEHRERERVCLVSSDLTLRETAGREVDRRSSRFFLDDLESSEQVVSSRSPVEERLDPETRAKLERLRRGRQ
ncbi:MAG: NYN domain-containing protein [Gaiellaceae bacterium]